MKSKNNWLIRTVLALTLCLTLSSCDDPQIYGSVGISSYGGGGYHGGGARVGTSISIGGRIR